MPKRINMLPAGHFAVGASIGYLVNICIYVIRRGRTTFRHLFWMPVSIILCGFWAFGPDWIRFVKKMFHLPYAYSIEAHRPGWPDLFFFHGFLDSRYPGRGTIIGLAVIIFIFASLIAIYLLEIRRLLKIIGKDL